MTHEERIASDADNPLNERRCNLVGRYANCQILRRRDKDRDVAALGASVARQITARERDVRAETELVDEEPIADEKRRLHAAAWNPVGSRRAAVGCRGQIASTGRMLMMNARPRTASDARGTGVERVAAMRAARFRRDLPIRDASRSSANLTLLNDSDGSAVSG